MTEGSEQRPGQHVRDCVLQRLKEVGRGAPGDRAGQGQHQAGAVVEDGLRDSAEDVQRAGVRQMPDSGGRDKANA